MRRIAVISVTFVSLLVMQLGLNGQDSNTKTPPKSAAAQPAPKPAAPAAAAPATKAATEPTKQPAPVKPAASQPAAAQATTPSPATPEQRSPDEIAILQTGESYVKAFNQGDAKAVAEHYTTDAEYIDEAGNLTQGRSAIEESLKSFFTANPERSIQLSIGSIRIVGPGVAIEDGTTTVARSKTSEPVTNRYTAVHVKNAGKWQVASVRDSAIRSPRQHQAQLKQLDWMLGEWVHEGDDALVFFSCQRSDKGNFLIRNFRIHIAGQEAMSGSQRIGWDAQTGKLKAWIFDSDGGHSEGYWHRDGDTWVLKTTGVTADGMTASSTSIYRFVNEHTMTFQSVDHEIAGMELPDGGKVKIVRHAPQPE